MKFEAPPHTTDVHIAGEVFSVDDKGLVEVPDDTPSNTINGLLSSGFTEVVAEKPKGTSQSSTGSTGGTDTTKP